MTLTNGNSEIYQKGHRIEKSEDGAYTYYQQQNLDEAAVEIQKVHVDVLTDSMKSVYTTIRDATGVAGIGDTEGVQRQENSSDSTEDTSSSEDTSYEDTSYDESDYSNYDEEYYE